MESISTALGEFANSVKLSSIPRSVVNAAKLSILDSVGIAFAASTHDFAHRAASALVSFGSGENAVIGMRIKLPMRDAALLNGMLVHGLDYDDTHIRGVIHPSASCFPCALAVAANVGAAGEDMLAAYIIGVEAASRLASVAKGQFQQAGFHPTGVVAVFACALVAGRLMHLSSEQLTMAQGIALSMAAGSMEFFEEGAWTKRMHAGWAASSGVTAAKLAKHGFTGPRKAYEGRFGVFNNYLNRFSSECDPAEALTALGDDWQTQHLAIKPYASCHFNHALIDAAIALRNKYNLNCDDIIAIKALLPKEGVKLVCEPMEGKLRPATANDAQGSLYYAVAVAIVRGRFGLEDLELEALRDPTVLNVARMVTWEVDPESAFPASYSGEICVTTKNGQQFRYREKVNRGARDNPLNADDVTRKYFENMAVATSRRKAEDVARVIFAIDQMDAHELTEVLR